MSVNVIKTIVNVATSSTFTLFSRTVFCKTTCTQTLKCKMTLTLIGLSIELMVRISKWFLSYVTCNWMFPIKSFFMRCDIKIWSYFIILKNTIRFDICHTIFTWLNTRITTISSTFPSFERLKVLGIEKNPFKIELTMLQWFLVCLVRERKHKFMLKIRLCSNLELLLRKK